ncbi:hypothetical protein [Streptomyces hoynatensis]|uniref:hypothetical protein n=1 Tax=Streptomyces hoynatensis TaxID=1141874 RepID=UPI0011C44D0D|nr:hypothetical protein [Streptomyces hoynatensis]
MSSRTVKAVADILSDPQNQEKTAEEIAEAVIEKVRETDALVSRVAVVGQIQEGSRPPLTVVLGPFSARGILDTPEKFAKATAGGTAARTAGEGLAWNPSTKVGRGRFMLAPIFKSPREAWDFHKEIPVFNPPGGEYFYQAAHALTAWNPEQIEPACVCGLRAGIYCHKHMKRTE